MTVSYSCGWLLCGVVYYLRKLSSQAVFSLVSYLAYDVIRECDCKFVKQMLVCIYNVQLNKVRGECSLGLNCNFFWHTVVDIIFLSEIVWHRQLFRNEWLIRYDSFILDPKSMVIEIIFLFEENLVLEFRQTNAFIAKQSSLVVALIEKNWT